MAKVYVTPLTGRYASPEMSHNFSEEKKFQTWRTVWTWLAQSEKVRHSLMNKRDPSMGVFHARGQQPIGAIWAGVNAERSPVHSSV